MLQRSTVIYVAIALSLGSMALVVSQRQISEQTTPASPQLTAMTTLLDFQETDIRAVVVSLDDTVLRFEQRPSPIDQWWLSQPLEEPANRGAIAYLLNLLLEPQPIESFAVEPSQLPDYGLVDPYSTITVETTDSRIYELKLGAENFDRTKIYGRLNDEETVLVLPITFRNGVTRELSEWINTDQVPIPAN